MLVYGSFALFCRRLYAPAAAAAALGVLARPDGVLAALVLFAAYLAKERRFPLRDTVLFLIITLPWVAFAFTYYGDVFPQTFYAKKGSIPHGQYLKEYVIRGIGDWIFSRNQQWLPLPAFIIPVIGFVAGAWHNSYLRISLLYALAMVAGYTIIASEDPWHSYPVMVAALLCLGYGIWQVAVWAGTPFTTQAARRKVTAVVVVSLALPILLWQISDTMTIRDGYAHTWLGGPRHKAYVQAAEWLNKHAPPSSTVLTPEPGTIAYYSHCILYDYWGLISKKGWKVSWRDAPVKLKPAFVIWNNAEKGDEYPVPKGYILRKTITVPPYPEIFISERTASP